MAQSPYKVDQLQIEPGAAGSRLLRKNADGSLEFVDPTYPSGVKLTTLVTAGTAAVAATHKMGAVAFANEASKAVVLNPVYADAVYTVVVEFDSDPAGAYWITNKLAGGFTIHLPAAATVNARWLAIRL